MTEDIKEEVKEEEATETTEEVAEGTKEATETTEEVVEETKETSELEEAQARAEEFENKYLRVHAEMQNIQRRAKEERQQLQKYRSQDLAKAILPSLDNIERALAITTSIWLFKPCLQMMSIRRIPSHKSSRKATNSMTASYAQPW